METFELGEWVQCEAGIGQILFIRKFYVEEFVEPASYEGFKRGDLYKTFYGIKVFCDFDGKLRKRKPFDFYLSINHLDKKYTTVLNKTKKENWDDYQSYLTHCDRDDPISRIENHYKIDPARRAALVQIVEEARLQVKPNFKYKEFKKIFEKMQNEVQLKDFVRYGSRIDREERLVVIFFSTMYKVSGKERIFDYVKAI